ncbi:MAG TPA: c-type cytochrome [Metalysinibacillus jejuensis]|uniref:C-type cytochrome n=1 Tax=Metalysinibacillus jejuensis TaxID=914327 RepID=A0A921NAU0_9BACL|nr:cytochrome c [Metalysinibacillus jejuensis]HJH10238.1 c-type cytochrome [Metalysinibacillus jejuensis]
MKKALLTAVFGSALFLAACGGGDDAAKDKDTTATDGGNTTEVAAGEAIAKQKCISCHGGDLKGQGSTPSLIGTGKSADELQDIIENGSPDFPGMPPGLIKGDDAKEVATWLAEQK